MKKPTSFERGGAVAMGIMWMFIEMKQFVYFAEIRREKAKLDAKLKEHQRKLWGREL